MKSQALIFQLSIGIVLSVTTIGCGPKYYIPTAQNVPVITSKGQENITATGNDNQIELQGAYGITEQLALQLNGGYISIEEDNGNGGTGKFIETAIGYYKNINTNFLFDTYAIVGGGMMENYFPTTVTNNPSTTGNISANLLRLGIQPGISFHRKYFSVSGSARIMSLNYSNIKGSLVFDNVDQNNYLNNNKSHFMIEPALTVRGGFEKIKFQLQLVKSLNLTNSNFKQDDVLLSVGLNVNVGTAE